MIRYKVLLEYHKDIGKMELADQEDEFLPHNFRLWGWDHISQRPIYADEDFPLPTEKFDAHHNHKRKVEFESALALSVLQNAQLFKPTLQKIGHAINTYLDSHLSEEQKAEAGAHFRAYIYSDEGKFGTLGLQRDSEELSDREIYNLVQNGLVKWEKIELIMNAHVGALAIYREMLHCADDPVYKQWYSHLRTDDLFLNRGREVSEKVPEFTDTPGIEEKSTLPATVQLHSRMLDKTIRDHMNVSDFVFDAYQREIPFVSGPSGTLVECLVGAMMAAGNTLSQEELREYAFCCMGYLITSGAHSLHEIYVLAEKIGIPYVSGRYEAVIPERFEKTQSYQTLVAKYSDIIHPRKNEIFEEKNQVASTQLINTLFEIDSAKSRSTSATPNSAIENNSMSDRNTPESFNSKSSSSLMARRKGAAAKLKIFSSTAPVDSKATQDDPKTKPGSSGKI